MRIQRLDLTRFGNFTNTTLDLSAPGVHVVVGRNEAGKSTAMEAIRQLLYGIPVRSVHAFLHDSPNLRLGALIEGASQAPLEIVRVKKQTATLRDPANNPIDESVLQKHLHYVESGVYRSLFTVGHEEVAKGGEALLSSDGELGRALFSVSHGAADLNAVLHEIDRRSAALFKSSASLPKLNAAIHDYKAHSESAKKASTSSSQASRLEHELEAALRDQAESEGLRRGAAIRKGLLERVRFARPQLATREAHKAQMKAFESARLVDPELDAALEHAASLRAESLTRHNAAEAARERIAAKLDGVSYDAELMGQLEEIQAVASEHGGYLQYVKDLPTLHARAGVSARELDELVAGLPEGVKAAFEKSPHLRVDQDARIQELIGETTVLRSDVEMWDARLEETAGVRAVAERKMAEIPPPVDMQALVVMAERMRAGVDLESTFTASAQQLEQDSRSLENAIAALELKLDGSDVDAVLAPSIESIRSTRITLERLDVAEKRLLEQLEDVDKEESRVVLELETLLSREQPRSPDELTTARSRREAGWSLILDDWTGGGADSAETSAWAGEEALPLAYRHAVEHADEVADDLRAAAEAVTQRANMERSIGQLAVRKESLEDEQREIFAEVATVQRDWVARWSALGVTARTPEEMEQWHQKFRDAAQNAIALRALAGDVAVGKERIERFRADLDAEMRVVKASTPTDLSLGALLRHAAETVETEKRTDNDRTATISALSNSEDKLREHRASFTRANEALAVGMELWGTAVKAIGLTSDASPAVASTVLKLLASIAAKQMEQTERDLRVANVERQMALFVDRLTRLLAKLPSQNDLTAEAASVAATSLNRRLNSTIATAAEVRTMTAEEAAAADSLSEAASNLRSATAEIETILQTTGFIDVNDLRSAIRTSREHQSLAQQISEIEKSIRDASSRSVEANEAEAREFDGIEIEIEIEDASRQLEALDRTLAEQAESVGDIRSRIAQMLPLQTAADSTTAAQESLALVADYGDEFVMLVMAKTLLQEQVLAYREQNQDPILKRARELFEQLTLGQYPGIDVDVDGKGTPRLMAVTSDERLLEVEALSSGTRDQLYLALRLGALEQMIEARGPLPVVLDDLFVHFDDQRTAAGLKVLDGFADHTQVLLFTHHERVAEEATKVIAAERLTTHRL